MNVLKDVKRTLKNWWIFVVLGILLIAASVIVLRTPVESYITLAWLFSILVLVNGFGSLFFCINNWNHIEGRGWYLLGSVVEIFIGFALVIYPDISLNMLPLFMGFWLLFRASFIISAAFEIKEYPFLNWGWVLLLGILLGIFSFLMIIHPVFGAGVIVYFTAIGIFMMGLAYISLGMQLKKIKAATLDKISDFKKNLRKSVGEVMTAGAAAVTQAAEEAKKEVASAASAYSAALEEDATETEDDNEDEEKEKED